MAAERFEMSRVKFALIVALVVASTTPSEITPASQERPQLEVTFCNFRLPAGIKQANASFYVSYSFMVDGEGKPTQIAKLRNDYVDGTEVSSCLEAWRLRGIPTGVAIVAIFRWEHAQGWVELSITGAGLNQRIRLTGERCPYSST